MVMGLEPLYLADGVIGTPEAIGITAVALAVLGVLSLVIKLAADERREEREVRAKEAAAVQAVLDAFRELTRRAS